MSSVNIGRFEIVRELGKSELGTVYKAVDPKKKRTVALRVLRTDTTRAAERSRQYLLDAKTASVLDSPNIVSIYSGAEEDGLAYVVMEYVEGIPLETALATEQEISSAELVDIARQVCRALDHAHSKGVYHRSLSPARVITEWDGTIKIMEFGLEAARSEQPRLPNELRYMSPEQVQGKPPDLRSNLFSWAAILYEMVTDRKAFAGESEEVVRRNIIDVMPAAPTDLNPKIPTGISRVIIRALAKNPDERFQSGAELVSELEIESKGGRVAAPAGAPVVNQQPPARPQAAPVPPPAAAAPIIPGLSPNGAAPAVTPRPVEAAAHVMTVAPPPPGNGHGEIAAVRSVPPPVNWPRPSQPAPAVRNPQPVAPSVAPSIPPLRKAASEGVSFSLSQQHIKILLSVIGAALVVMVGFIVADAVRAHRLSVQEEPTTAAAPPPVVMAAPDPTPPPPVVQTPVTTAVIDDEPAPSRRAVKTRRKPVSAAPAILSGELVVNSVPDGAQVRVDGGGPFTTPISLRDLSPGQHTVVLSKAGYTSETRSVLIHGGARTSLGVSMAPTGAVASIASDPQGATIFVDGHNTGKVTPARLSLEKGNHQVSLRKAGFLEASTSVSLNPGETLQVAPALKPLGNADDIKSVGKFKKLIGRGGPENTGRVMVRTFPKGGQVMFNQRMMDRTAPSEFLLGPGSYEVDLTLTGYKPIHTVITVEPNARLEVNETFQK